MSIDGSWIIIPPTIFGGSNGICKDLLRYLRYFYREENSRRMQRAKLIEEFDQFLLAQQMAVRAKQLKIGYSTLIIDFRSRTVIVL